MTQIAIEDLLGDLKNNRFIYCPNPGNGGDSLIAAGTYQVFERLGLRFDTPNLSRLDPRGNTIVYGGGGNLVVAGTHSVRMAQRLHSSAKRFIILPHTLKKVDFLLQDFSTNVDIVCRELASYEYVKASGTKANVYLAHDMAFSLDINQVFANAANKAPPSIPGYIMDRYVRSNWTQSLKNLIRSQKITSIVSRAIDGTPGNQLHCFRGDGEETGKIKIPLDNIDLPSVLALGTEMPKVAYFVAYHVLSFLNRFEVVHTDRLHMSIGSALLGKEVKFYANNYFKCFEVFKYSMKDQFPKVQWMG